MKTHIHPTKNPNPPKAATYVPALVLARCLPDEIRAFLRPDFFDAETFAQACEDAANCLKPGVRGDFQRHMRLMRAAEEFRVMAAKNARRIAPVGWRTV